MPHEQFKVTISEVFEPLKIRIEALERDHVDRSKIERYFEKTDEIQKEIRNLSAQNTASNQLAENNNLLLNKVFDVLNELKVEFSEMKTTQSALKKKQSVIDSIISRPLKIFFSSLFFVISLLVYFSSFNATVSNFITEHGLETAIAGLFASVLTTFITTNFGKEGKQGD